MTEFVCVHLVLFEDGRLGTEVLCRADRDVCEVVAERGPRHPAGGDLGVAQEEVIVRLASEWDSLMAEAARIEDGGSPYVQ